MKFAEKLDRLKRLSTEELDQASRLVRADLGCAEWTMGLCLLTWSETGAFRELGYSTVSEYGERALNLSGRKIGALLGAARALKHLPLLSEAYRRGEICWGKVRVIHGLATPETEGEWLKFALAHSTAEVARKVAFSPKEWKHHRALKASLETGPIASEEAVTAVLRDEVSAVVRGSKVPLTDRVVESAGASFGGESEVPEQDKKKWERPGLPAPPKTIRLVVELTPDQYALYEQAEIRLRSRAGKRINRAQVVTAMAESILNQGTARARAKHQILIHTTEDAEIAWYDTGRGMLPVAPEVLEEARDTPRMQAESQAVAVSVDPVRSESHVKAHTCELSFGQVALESIAKDHTCELLTEARVRSNNRRSHIPNATVRALYARAGQRCERCRGQGPFHIHHTVPVSEGGDNLLGDLKLMCPACHNLHHIEDFAHKPYWRLAKEAAMISRTPIRWGKIME
jgi:hypothetical protein